MMKVVTSCYMVYHVLFNIILFDFNVNGQPLYENPQEDPLGASDAHSFYWKIYERELLQQSKLKSLQTELEMVKDACTTPDLQNTSPSYPIPSQNTCTTRGSRGTSFVVLFMKNIGNTVKKIYVSFDGEVQLNITTSSRLDPFLKLQIDRAIGITSSHRILLPTALELNYFQKEVKSVLVETSSNANVFSFDTSTSASVGSLINLPVHKLSTKYIMVSATPDRKSQLALAAIKNNTIISITFKMEENIALNIEGQIFYNDNVFNLSLDRFETYQIAHSTDLTGTVIESTNPLAAYSGNDCVKLGGIGFCDHLITQLPPTDSVDYIYIVPPHSDNRDTMIRITAIEKSDIYYFIGAVNQTISLNISNSFDTKISSNQTCFIQSTASVLVTGFGLHSNNSEYGDPSITIIQGINQYISYYKTVIPAGYINNYASIMIKKSSQDFIHINNKKINASEVVFEENVVVGITTYSVRLIRVPAGELTAFTLDGERFGIIFTGVSKNEAYGFSGNILLP